MRAFLAIAEEGSFSAAARSLGVTQPTISRQLSALEDRLGVVLIERGPRNMTISEGGRAILRHAQGMKLAATELSLVTAGLAHTLEGPVTITASDAVCSYWLPAIVGRILEVAPGIEIRVLSDNKLSSLDKRVADIAIRHIQPKEPQLYSRFVKRARGRLYGTTDYIAKIGSDLSAARIVSLFDIGDLPERLARLGHPVPESSFCLKASSSTAGWELVKEGLGLGFMVDDIAKKEACIEAVHPETLHLPFDCWLVAHRELHSNPRIGLVFDILQRSFSGSD